MFYPNNSELTFLTLPPRWKHNSPRWKHNSKVEFCKSLYIRILGAWRRASLARAYYIDIIIDIFLFFSTTYVGVSGVISEITAVISEEINVISEWIFILLFKGVAPGGRSRAVRLELSLKPLIRKMLTHFGLRRARAAEYYSVKQRFSAC